MRERLAWNRVPFVEHEVERDAAARARLIELTGGRSEVPVLVEDGHVRQIGWHGPSCAIAIP